jgi:hypothetical protein
MGIGQAHLGLGLGEPGHQQSAYQRDELTALAARSLWEAFR